MIIPKNLVTWSHYLLHILWYIENAWDTVNNDFWVTSEAICQQFSRVTKSWEKILGKSHHEWQEKSLFTVTNALLDFLNIILCLEHAIPLKTIINRRFRHKNVANWHGDVIFVDCSHTCKLTQRRSSLVNNNREYRFLATWYSRLNV